MLPLPESLLDDLSQPHIRAGWSHRILCVPFQSTDQVVFEKDLGSIMPPFLLQNDWTKEEGLYRPVCING
jgi:hypothetical protein